MSQDPPSQPPGGLAAVFLQHRAALLRFLAARGAGDQAEDLLQEMWIKVQAAPGRPIGAPLPYLYRTADTMMIDRWRADAASRRRDGGWREATSPAEAERSDDPSGERVLIAREQAAEAGRVLAGLGTRVARIFRRHRLDGVPQRELARDEGVSLSTVESDLRRAARALIDLRERWDD